MSTPTPMPTPSNCPYVKRWSDKYYAIAWPKSAESTACAIYATYDFDTESDYNAYSRCTSGFGRYAFLSAGKINCYLFLVEICVLIFGKFAGSAIWHLQLSFSCVSFIITVSEYLV